MADMSLEEKIGQMMIVGFHGTTPSPDIRRLIEEYHVGGVTLFSRNIVDPLQVTRLVQELQDVAICSGPHLPLIIATDQEGGLVARIRRSAAVHPGNMAIGATRSSALSYAAGNLTGRELRAMGINMNLAPVLDVNNNPGNPVIGVRSFGEEADLVSRLGVAMIRGLQRNGVISTAKHFPGHGDTSQDSHEVLPVLKHTLERLRQIEIRPFRAAIKCGVMAVMIGHLSIPMIDRTPNIPATMSRRVVTRLLRQSLRYQRLVTTDCMEMKAITGNFEAGEAAVEAVKAGADLVMVSHTFKRQLESITKVQDAARDGEIDQRRIDSSVVRVLKAKTFAEAGSKRFGMRVVGSRKHLRSVAKMAEKSITLTSNKDILPLRWETGKRVLSISFVPSSIKRSTEDFLAILKRNVPPHVRMRGIGCDPQPSRKQLRKVRSSLSWADLAIAATYDIAHNKAQKRILQETATRIPLALVSMREPYDVAHVPETSAHVAAYSPAKCSVEAAVKAIIGRSKPAGRLPVSILPEYTVGYGLKHF